MHGPRPATTLVVLVVVDQLGSGMLEPIQPQLTGGFARFLRDGRRFTECAYDHAATFTGPGHATLITGMHPARHGIILNQWHDRAARREVGCTDAPEEGAPDNFDGGRAVSGGRLVGETLGDLLKRTDGASKVYAVSVKDRSAVLTAGRHPDGAYWFSVRTGAFTSNPVFGLLPAWGEEFWSRNLVDATIDGETIPDAWTYPIRAGARPDDDPHESERYQRAAPHPIQSARALRESPWSDWLTLRLARRILQGAELGADSHPDLLVVGLSATDYIGHAYGPGSQEHLDQLLRLDGWLGEFMLAADAAAARGGGQALYALSSDHGVLPLPENLEGGRRIADDQIDKLLREAVAGAVGVPAVVEAISGPHIYLDHAALDRLGITLDDAAQRARAAIAALPDVARVYTAADLASTLPGDPFLELERHSWRADRGGDLVVQMCERCLVSDSTTGTSHGTPYDYDRRVPLVLLGGGVAAGESKEACRTVDLAPTLAAALALPRFDSPRDGRALRLQDVDTQDPLK